MLVPGISGGTIAIILDIYNELLSSLSDLFKDFKKNFLYLFIAFFGGIVGVIISSFILEFFISNFHFELVFIFIGIMLKYIFTTLNNKNIKLSYKIVYIIIGLIFGYLITLIPIGLIDSYNNVFILLLLGIFLAIALILPGISVSYVLLIFGLYDTIIISIKEINIMYLFKIGIFLIIGLLLVIKVLNYFIKKKSLITEYIIVGFIISSIFNVIPKIHIFSEIVYAIIFILLGIFIKTLFYCKK